MRSIHLKLPLLASVSLFALVSAVPAQTSDIGQVAAVNRDMDGTPPNTVKRQLELGFGIVENERIETSDRGSGQLLFLDQTSLTVSQNSDIVLDKYVYDASADQGDMAMTMTKGALRFIGGRITKKRRAMVRTPTATIGIRGGLVIIRVLPDGTTRVVQMAGESTTVESYGDSDGDGVDDGPSPGDQELFFGGGIPFGDGIVILSRPGATAEVFPSGGGEGTGSTGGTSGSSDGGEPQGPSDVTYAGIISSEELADEYDGFEGGQSGGTDNVPGDEGVNESSTEIASVNSDQPGGQNNQPVSTSGEEPPQPPDPLLAFNQDQPPLSQTQEVGDDVADITDFNDPDPVDPVDPVNPVDPILPPPPVDPILPTGTTLTGGGISVDGAPLFPFSAVTSGSIIGQLPVPIFDFDQVTLDLPESASQLEPTDEMGESLFAQTRFPQSGFFQVATEFSPSGLVGTADGFAAFSNDTDPEFLIAEIPQSDALVFFGRSSPNQTEAFVEDPLLNSGSRSITAYQVEGLEEDTLQTDSSTFNIITNGPGDGDGSRVLFASLVESSDDGLRDFSVVAGALDREDSGLPVFDFTVASIGTDDVQDQIVVRLERLTAFQDIQGNTLFGPENDFIVIGGPISIGVDGTPSDQNLPPNTEVEFFFNDQGDFADAQQAEVTLLTRDPASRLVADNPRSILNNVPLREVQGANTFDSVLATGFATCSGGRTCGQLDASFYRLSSEPVVPGADASTVGSFQFDPQANSVAGGFTLTAGFEANTLATSTPFNQNFLFTLDPQDSAVFTDQFFAGSTLGTPIADIQGAVQPQSDFIIATSEAVGASQQFIFPAGVNPTPEFATWGFWAASFDVVDSQTGLQIRDNVDLGTFVAGVRPDATLFQNFADNFVGSAGFSGLAVGTARSQLAPGQSGVSEIVTGSFDLQYDFAIREGSISLSLPSENLTAIGEVVGPSNNPSDPSYSGGIGGGNFTGFVNGAFYTGGPDVVAATGGQFDLLDSSAGRQIVGVFAGDRSN
ncbi:MAG: FecR domain-containing protein [Pseudomonadota bacterium]